MLAKSHKDITKHSTTENSNNIKDKSYNNNNNYSGSKILAANKDSSRTTKINVSKDLNNQTTKTRNGSNSSC